MVSRLEGSDIKTIRQIVKKNYWDLQRLGSGDSNEIFEVIKETIQQTDDRENKLYLLSFFSEQKSQDAIQMLKQEFNILFTNAKDMETIEQIVRENSSGFRGLQPEEINDIFALIKDSIQQSDDFEGKNYLLTFFTNKKIEDAEQMLREEIDIKLTNAESMKIIEQVVRKNYSYLQGLDPESIDKIFNILKDKIKDSDDGKNKLYVLRFFINRKIKEAKPMLSQEIKNMFIHADDSELTRMIRNRSYREVNKKDLIEMFDKIDLDLLRKSKEILVLINFLYVFSKTGIQEARTLLNGEIMNRIPEYSGHLSRWIQDKYLNYMEKDDVKKIFEKIDFGKKLERDFQGGVSLLNKFKKMGIENTDEIIRARALTVFKNINLTNINMITNKTFEKQISTEELHKFIKANDSDVIKNLLSLFRESLSSTQRSKVHKLLKKVTEVAESEPLLRKSIVKTFESATKESIPNLLKSKLFDYLNEEEKLTLLSDPNYILKGHLVMYKGSSFIVDHYLKLNLSNQNIESLRDIVGLNDLSHLKTLDVSGNDISQIIGMGNLASLKKLKITGNPIPDDLIKHLGGVDSKGFAKDPQKFVDYSQLEASGVIESVNVKGKKYEAFENKLVLTDLQIKSLEEIKGLSSLKSLINLDLSSNQITDLKGIEELTSLKVLKLSNNKISNTSGIEELINLEELRLFGNQVYELKGVQHLKNLKILDLDAKRKISIIKYLKYLLNSLETSELKEICTNYNMQCSKLDRNSLIKLIRSSLTDEEERDVINDKEMTFIPEAIKKAFKLLENKQSEINEIKVVDADTNEVEFRFKGRPLFYISITPDNIDNPDRDCNCSIGSSMGFCNHFWVGVLYSLKQGYFDASDWTLTPLPDDLMDDIKQLKL